MIRYLRQIYCLLFHRRGWRLLRVDRSKEFFVHRYYECDKCAWTFIDNPFEIIYEREEGKCE